jgi:hypothetical protein
MKKFSYMAPSKDALRHNYLTSVSVPREVWAVFACPSEWQLWKRPKCFDDLHHSSIDGKANRELVFS